MQFLVDDEDLEIGLVLEEEHPSVDLTRDRLGERILDLAVSGMLDSHARFQSPEGDAWPPLARSTARAKKSTLIGVRTGRSGITDPATYRAAPRDYRAREVWWAFSTLDLHLWKIAHGWQNGNPRNHCPARRLIGWTPAAQEAARELVRDADFAARE